MGLLRNPSITQSGTIFFVMSSFDEALRKAGSGSVVSQGYVGWCYLYGQETDVSYPEALRWLSAAAYEDELRVHMFILATCTRQV
jgi:hypothetical protein